MAVGVQLQMHKLWHANLEEYGRDEHTNVLFLQLLVVLSCSSCPPHIHACNLLTLNTVDCNLSQY